MGDIAKNEQTEHYDNLQHTLEQVAMGIEQSTTQIMEITDEYGHKTTSKQVTKVSAMPDAKILQHLIDQRIGGPQDYC